MSWRVKATVRHTDSEPPENTELFEVGVATFGCLIKVESTESVSVYNTQGASFTCGCKKLSSPYLLIDHVYEQVNGENMRFTVENLSDLQFDFTFDGKESNNLKVELSASKVTCTIPLDVTKIFYPFFRVYNRDTCGRSVTLDILKLFGRM